MVHEVVVREGIALLVLSSALVACKPATTRAESEKPVAAESAKPQVQHGQPWPAGPLVEEPILIAFAVYALPGGRADVVAAATQLHAERYQHLTAFEGVETKPPVPGLWIVEPPMGEFAPPDPNTLQYFGRGLSTEQAAAVQQSPAAVLLMFTADHGTALRVHADAIAMAATLSEQVGGLVWDENTREMFTREAWRAREQSSLEDPIQLTAHFTMHAYRDGELIRIVTLGLEKFGVPNVVVANVPASVSEPMGMLVNLVAAAMIRNKRIDRDGIVELDLAALVGVPPPGHPARVEVQLAVGQPQDGDAPGPLAEIVFPGPVASLHQRQHALLDRVFGDVDPVVYTEHDAELLAASEHAKKQLAAMKPRFAKGVPDREVLHVKAPFETPDGGNEWMWVEVVRWNGTKIEGILQNDAVQIPGLKAGAKVEVDEASLFDYITAPPTAPRRATRRARSSSAASRADNDYGRCARMKAVGSR